MGSSKHEPEQTTNPPVNIDHDQEPKQTTNPPVNIDHDQERQKPKRFMDHAWRRPPSNTDDFIMFPSRWDAEPDPPKIPRTTPTSSSKAPKVDRECKGGETPTRSGHDPPKIPRTTPTSSSKAPRVDRECKGGETPTRSGHARKAKD